MKQRVKRLIDILDAWEDNCPQKFKDKILDYLHKIPVDIIIMY
jgi:hypothetical protein